MKRNGQQKGLLERLRLEVGYDYLSDLYGSLKKDRKRILKAVDEARKTDFSLEEWTDAVIYILGTSPNLAFESIEEAIFFLKTY